MTKLLKKARVKKTMQEILSRERKQRNKLKSYLRKYDCKRFNGRFVCAVCGHTRTNGYDFYAPDGEYEVCNYCHASIYTIHSRPHLLYTPMGNKK